MGFHREEITNTPVLFYAKDTNNYTATKCSMIKYADDTFIYSSKKDIGAAKTEVRMCEESLRNYFAMNKLSLYVKKRKS